MPYSNRLSKNLNTSRIDSLLHLVSTHQGRCCCKCYRTNITDFQYRTMCSWSCCQSMLGMNYHMFHIVNPQYCSTCQLNINSHMCYPAICLGCSCHNNSDTDSGLSHHMCCKGSYKLNSIPNHLSPNRYSSNSWFPS